MRYGLLLVIALPLASCANQQAIDNYVPYGTTTGNQTQAYYQCKAESDRILYGPGNGMMAAYSSVQYMDNCMMGKGYQRVRR